MLNIFTQVVKSLAQVCRTHKYPLHTEQEKFDLGVQLAGRVVEYIPTP